MVIQHNLSAIQTLGILTRQGKQMGENIEKLSSGYRINRAADSAAELSLSQKMRAKLIGLDRGEKNIEEGLCLTQTADGALQQVNEMLCRMKELTVQSMNGTYENMDRGKLQQEMKNLVEEIDRIAHYTEYNDIKPLLYKLPEMTPQKILQSYTQLQHGDIKMGYLTKLTGNKNDYLGKLKLGIEGANFPLAGIWTDPNLNYTSVRMKVTCNGTEKLINLNNSNQGNLTRTVDPDAGTCDYKYDNGDVKFTVRQRWKYVDRITDKSYGKYYDVSYEFINESTAEAKMSLLIPIDMLVGPYCNSTPVIDGVARPSGWKFSGGNLPTELRFDADGLQGDSGGDVNINVSAIFQGEHIVNKPDVVLSANLHSVGEWNHIDTTPDGNFNGTASDYFYSVTWKDKMVSAGGSFFMNTLIGVNAPYEYTEKTISEYREETIPPPKQPEGLWIQASAKEGDGFYIFVCDATAENLGLENMDISSQSAGSAAMEKIAGALEKVLLFRGRFGADMNRMEHALALNGAMYENETASESRIRDLDVASQMSQFVKTQVLMQSAQALLAQANQQPQTILRLLQ